MLACANACSSRFSLDGQNACLMKPKKGERGVRFIGTCCLSILTSGSSVGVVYYMMIGTTSGRHKVIKRWPRKSPINSVLFCQQVHKAQNLWPFFLVSKVKVGDGPGLFILYGGDWFSLRLLIYCKGRWPWK